jgi:hypothetical protein
VGDDEAEEEEVERDARRMTLIETRTSDDARGRRPREPRRGAGGFASSNAPMGRDRDATATATATATVTATVTSGGRSGRRSREKMTVGGGGTNDRRRRRRLVKRRRDDEDAAADDSRDADADADAEDGSVGEAGEEAREASVEEGTMDAGAMGAGRRDVDAVGRVCAGFGTTASAIATRDVGRRDAEMNTPSTTRTISTTKTTTIGFYKV